MCDEGEIARRARDSTSLSAPPLLTLVLLRVLDILLFRKLKVRLTLYFSDSTLEGIMYLSHSSSSSILCAARKQRRQWMQGHDDIVTYIIFIVTNTTQRSLAGC